jgi:hypothetical protein
MLAADADVANLTHHRLARRRARPSRARLARDWLVRTLPRIRHCQRCEREQVERAGASGLVASYGRGNMPHNSADVKNKKHQAPGA